MPTEILLIAGLTTLAALVLGFLAGRLSAPGLRKNEALREQRDDSQRELDRMRQQVDHHFSETARLFANMAQDYRALYEHLAESASELGLSDSERHEILVSATKPLPSDGEAKATGSGWQQAMGNHPAARAEAMGTGVFNRPGARA